MPNSQPADSSQITYDLSTQVSATELPALRNQILMLLKEFAVGPKPIRVQLCVCLAILAIQMKDWDDVLPSVVQSLSDSPESHACILDFLRVLPEEVTEGRKITLSVCGCYDSIRQSTPTTFYRPDAVYCQMEV